jgi:Zn-finger nucleic acid-binding protein
MTDRSGVEIDYCPKCRGVWLDRGELDKIIERSQSHSSALKSDDSDRRHHDDDHRKHHEDDNKYRKKKKDSFLGDLFDF